MLCCGARLKKSLSEGENLKEAQAINKSLSALGDVISALATEQQHIPYRNHKLTMLMSDSLGGNAKTLMFVNVSPTDSNLDETQNSLQYATRVRTIKVRERGMASAGCVLGCRQVGILLQLLSPGSRGPGGCQLRFSLRQADPCYCCYCCCCVASLQNTASKNEVSKDVLKMKKQIDYWKEQAGLPPDQRAAVDAS